jgi:hypothetical protein
MSQPLIGVVRLSLATVAIMAVWLVVLPAVGELASVRQRIEGNHAAGINPTAVFYTDHPAMADIERRIAAKVDAPSAWFWKRSK